MPVPRNLCEGEEYRPVVGRVQLGSYTPTLWEIHLPKFSAKFRTLSIESSEATMEKILTSRAVAVSEFKRAPNEIVAEANGEPIAVLTNNKPSFYVISPSAYEEMLEKVWESEITPTLLKRLDDVRTGKTKSVEVTLKDLVK
ncbi:MAG: hypothetical protein EBX19_02915 [Actinobacteria bacterium]|nr:hypothetical protein [Actinomycetota bacterium]